jgi:hypothetical protein
MAGAKRKLDEDTEPAPIVRTCPADVMTCLGEIDLELQRLGQHGISPWWWQQLGEFYRSQRWLFVGRVGRRGGKSDTVSKVAIAEVLTGRHKIPLGDVGVVSVVSTDRKEAGKRVRTIDAYLTALNVEHKTLSDEITFIDRPYKIEVKTASVSGVSGFTSILCIGDEVGKWKDVDTGANPAAEVLSSWKPTLLTMPDARMFLLSSPWAVDDAHARAFDHGTTDTQQAAWAPTWIAHPTLTREMCQRAEENPVTFRREYEAIPSAEAEDSLHARADLERACRPHGDLPREDGVSYVGVLDMSRPPAWTLVVAALRRCSDGVTRASAVLARQFLNVEKPGAVMVDVAHILDEYGLTGVACPVLPRFARTLASPLDLSLVQVDVTDAMHESLRLRAANDGLELPNNGDILRDLLGVRRDDAGKIRLTVADGRRCDYAPALALAMDRLGTPPDAPPAPVVPTLEWWQAQEVRRAVETERRDRERDYAQQKAINEQRDAEWIADRGGWR